MRGERGAKVTIRLNGQPVRGLGGIDGRRAVRVDLQSTNSITVELRGKPGTSVSVRVEQRVDVDTDVTGVGIYGIQVFGYTHATYGTGDLDAAVSPLRAQGVEVMSDPAGAPGSRFVFLKDPDGTYLRLVEDVGVPAQPVPTA